MHDILRKHIEKVIPLTDDEFAYVLSHFNHISYKKRQYIIREGEHVGNVYFVVSGLLKLEYTDMSAKQHVVSFAMEDWWETDFMAFFNKTKATMSLQCIEDTEVFCMSLTDYQKLCTGLQKMERFFLEKSTAGHIASQQRILSFLTSNARERYEQLLRQNPSLLQRVPKSLLASYLGVSRETLSRLFS